MFLTLILAIGDVFSIIHYLIAIKLAVSFILLCRKQAVQVSREPLLPLGAPQATLGHSLIVKEIQQADTRAEVNQRLNEVALHLSYGPVHLTPVEVAEPLSIDNRVVHEDRIDPTE